MKYSVLLISMFISISFAGLIIAQDLPADEENGPDKPATEEKKPPKPPVPFKYLEKKPDESKESEGQEVNKPVVQFLFDGNLTDQVNQLSDYIQYLTREYGEKIIKIFSDINKFEDSKKRWDFVLEQKGIKETDVVAIISYKSDKNDRFVIGLNNIVKTLANHINFTLEPDKYADPMQSQNSGMMRSKNYMTKPQIGGNVAPTSQTPADATGTIDGNEDGYKSKFVILLTIFIAFVAFAIGIFVAWLILKNKKSPKTEITKTE